MATQWFLVCNPELNEQIAAFLAARGLAMESERRDLHFDDRQSREGWLIPGYMVEKVRASLRAYPQFKATFFTQSSPGAKLHKAGFVFKRRKSAALRRAEAELQKLKCKAKKIQPNRGAP